MVQVSIPMHSAKAPATIGDFTAAIATTTLEGR